MLKVGGFFERFCVFVCRFQNFRIKGTLAYSRQLPRIGFITANVFT